MKAGRIAVQRLNTYLQAGITFNQETTLCGHTILRTINRAKQSGYVIEFRLSKNIPEWYRKWQVGL